jgi:hypothetical protein
MQPPPDLGHEGACSTIRALSLIDERMIRVLELEAVVAKAESVAA